MVKPGGPGVYSATYSNIPVYEYQFGEALKEHVMRRRGDDWINATHILKAAGFDKPARTRILEREVQKGTHEKVQGGYGKYQGTWVPLESGIALAKANSIWTKLQPIFEFDPGNISPPPAPKHTTAKPKQPKKPAVPKWSNTQVAAPPRVIDDDYDNISAQLNDDESMADDVTVASASFIAEDDRFDMSQHGTGHRKRKHEDIVQAAEEKHRIAHMMYSDDLLDYFMLSSHQPANKPEPPINFQPDWIIENDGHTALHWGAAMGDMSVVKEMIRHGADIARPNIRGETPLMRAVMFTNCEDKQVMPAVVKELAGTLERTDKCQSTVLHHAAMLSMSRQKYHCSRYYLEVLLTQMCTDITDQQRFQRLIDAQDINGDTALHLAAKNRASKCVRALQGRGASGGIINKEGRTADQLIYTMMHEKKSRAFGRSSSPYAPDYENTMPEDTSRDLAHISEAGMSMQSRVKPAVHERMEELAMSFDEAMRDKEAIEKGAQRVLRTTAEELRTTQDKIMDLQMSENKPLEEHRRVQVAHLENESTSLVEQQQSLQLRNLVQQEQSKANGHVMADDDVIERALLAQQLMSANVERLGLVQQYIEARGLAGAGEKGEQYRKLITACVGPDIELLDLETLDALIEHLKDDRHDREGEIIDPEDL